MQNTRRNLEALTRGEKEKIALGAIGEVEGLPSFSYTDGPNGVRDAEGATVFPSALTLAASFDLALAHEYGQALGGEVRSAGRNVLLGPTADVLRVPWNGRSGESFGEDPLLSGEMAGTIGAAVQSVGVLAVLKHFVANNFERLRTGRGAFFTRTPAVNVNVAERALREIYLEPFRRALQRYGVAALMTSYNRLRGQYIAEDAAMLDFPRKEWGFSGATFPDFMFAVRDPAAALRAGLDIPGLDGPSGRQAEDVSSLSEERIDAIATHVLNAIEAVNLTESEPAAESLGGSVALALAQRIATDGAVLLRNENVLPLAQGCRVALIAPNSLYHLAVIGGSAGLAWPAERASSLHVELERAGFVVDEVDAGDADIPLEPLNSGVLSDTARVTLRDNSTGLETELELDTVELFERPEGIGDEWSARADLQFLPPRPGLYRFSLDVAGDATFRVAGTEVSGFREASPMLVGPAYPLQAIADSSGEPIALSIEFDSGAALDAPPIGLRPGFRLGWSEISAQVQAASEAALRADVAVVVVGRATGEAMDADSLRLPAVQERVIHAVADANPRTVVVTGGSGPVVMPWRRDVAAVLHVGQAGERLAAALASILSGESEPGGRLPFSIPETEADVPLSSSGYPGDSGTASYDEGLNVGYRGYESTGVKPAFVFGHGIGYTTIDIHSATLDDTESAIVVSAIARNHGARTGKFVPQVYVTSIDGTSPRALRAFTSLEVAAGADREFRVEIPHGDLREFDEESGSWRLPSRFQVELCASSDQVLWRTPTPIRSS